MVSFTSLSIYFNLLLYFVGALQVLDVKQKGANVSQQARRRRDEAGINRVKDL